MKHTKRRFELFSFFDHTGISTHLEQMAWNGWMLEKITNFGWIYRKTEPKAIHFTVSYYPKASEFDPEPSEEQKTFHEFCAHTGWKLACTSAQMQIFYNEQDNPIPIETEPELELASIHATAKKTIILTHLLLLGISFMQAGLFISDLLGDPIGLLASPSRLFVGFCALLLFLLCVTELGSYFLWYKKAKAAASHGEFLKTPNTTIFQRIIVIAVLIGGFFWMVNFILGGDSLRRFIGIGMCIYMPALFLLVNGTKNYLKRKKVSKKVNFRITMLVDFVLAFSLMGIITFLILSASSKGFFAEKDEETYEHNGITWILHNDELPLTLEDLTGLTYDGYIKEQRGDESLLLGQWTYKQRPRFDVENYSELPHLSYTAVYVKSPAFYDLCKNHILKKEKEDYALLGKEYKLIDSGHWDALEVYQLHDSEFGFTENYLLCYENLIVEISLSFEPKEDQQAIIRDQLTK